MLVFVYSPLIYTISTRQEVNSSAHDRLYHLFEARAPNTHCYFSVCDNELATVFLSMVFNSYMHPSELNLYLTVV
jgi:hypothetical protein